MVKKCICLLVSILAICAFILQPMFIPSALAQSTAKTGCEKETIDIDKYGGKPFQNPEEIRSKNGLLETAIEVRYAQNQIAACSVNLRSYNGKLVGPTLRVKPEDTIKVTLINNLPPESNPQTDQNNNLPRAFNTTNFHTHGLHVSPEGNSDNVLREMPPQDHLGDAPPQYPIEIALPNHHPGGTYWYHSHLHGSTALQVSSGMAGALIVEGGLDHIPEIAAAKEKIFVFQQITYDEQGTIENYNDLTPTGWTNSKRYTTINGQIVPKIEMRPGEVQHWRFIHAGVGESLNLHLTQVSDNRPISLREIALDGIPLGRMDNWNRQALELEPGYRSDVLVKSKLLKNGQRSQEYVLVDSPSSPQKSLKGAGETGSILAKVVVKGLPVKMALPNADQLAKVAMKEQPADIVTTDGEQKVEFSLIACSASDCKQKFNFEINGQEFSHDSERTLMLGNAEEWNLTTSDASLAPSHPFHIHVNPFLHQRSNPQGKLEKVWRDTLLVTQGHPEKIWTRYSDFVGKFVLHCHILDHEDQGMMQLVNIVQEKLNNTISQMEDNHEIY